MKAWITSVFAASLLSSLALALCPQGRVKGVVRMVCGLVCALAVASPLVRLNMGSLAAGMAAYGQQARSAAETGEEEQKMLERTYIEEQCAAYILAKASDLGAKLEGASVLARWDEDVLVWYPWEAVMTGPRSSALSRAVEAELGIPAERQEWRGGEEPDGGVGP